jgi:hypothetical protein
MTTNTNTGFNAYAAGKAHPENWRTAVKILRGQSIRKANGLPTNTVIWAMAWGSIMGAAQQIDPTVKHRYAAVTILGIGRNEIFG